MYRKIDQYAPKVQFYGYQIQILLFNMERDQEKPFRNVLTNELEGYEQLYQYVSAYWWKDVHRVNEMLMNLFMSPLKSVRFYDAKSSAIEIELKLFRKKGSKVPVTIDDFRSISEQLNDISYSVEIGSVPQKLGDAISTLGKK